MSQMTEETEETLRHKDALAQTAAAIKLLAYGNFEGALARLDNATVITRQLMIDAKRNTRS